MAGRTALPVQSIVNTGLTPVFSAANEDGHSVVNDGNMFIEVKNAGAEMTVTIQTPRTVDGLAVAEDIVTIPLTTGDKMIGPFKAETFNQAGGVIYVDFSRASDVTVGAFKM